jgi:hypothetical protein
MALLLLELRAPLGAPAPLVTARAFVYFRRVAFALGWARVPVDG